jgi:thiol:disulfide interchange protein DsbA
VSGPERRRRLLLGGAIATLPLPSGMASAQGTTGTPGAPARGATGYRVLALPQPAPEDRIEVLEFFYYGCPFCFQLEPMLVDWQKRLPPDVVFDRVPVIGRDSWVPLGRLYYTLGELGAAATLHGAAYRAVHVESIQLGQFDLALDWAARNGLDRERFGNAWRSAEVEAKTARARRMTDEYDIQATPSIVVDGRLLTSSGLTAGVVPLLPMVDRLIAMVRTDRAGGRPA